LFYQIKALSLCRIDGNKLPIDTGTPTPFPSFNVGKIKLVGSMAHKICTKCKQDKELSEFNKCSRVKDGHKAECRDCQKKGKKVYDDNHPNHNHDYYTENTEKILKQNKEWAINHREQSNQIKNNYVIRHPKERLEQSNRYYHNNTDRVKIYVNNNREEINKKRRIYMQTHPQARMAHNLRSRLGAVLSGRSKGGRLYSLVGCDMDYFKNYIEKFWTEGMFWSNYGKDHGRWSLDHTIPLESFDLTNEEEQKEAFHYTNMRPMWYPENSSKGSLHNGKRHNKKNKYEY
jgi:hypothetical protein